VGHDRSVPDGPEEHDRERGSRRAVLELGNLPVREAETLPTE
jgi:hypothetical protein